MGRDHEHGSSRSRTHWCLGQGKSRNHQKNTFTVFLIMYFEQAKQDIINWVTGFVEQPNAKLNGWAPCPHARQARIRGQFDIQPGTVDPYSDLQNVNLGDFMVIAFVYDAKLITADEFEHSVDRVNREHLVQRDILALSDHPDSHEQVLGVCMNQGEYAIVFVQPLSKLNQFARAIANKGYYQGWPEDYLTDLFQHREDPRL